MDGFSFAILGIPLFFLGTFYTKCECGRAMMVVLNTIFVIYFTICLALAGAYIGFELS